MIGEIGGDAEEQAAQFLIDEAKRGRKKPMVGFIAAAPRLRAAAWATPAPSCRAARAMPSKIAAMQPPASPCRPVSPSESARRLPKC